MYDLTKRNRRFEQICKKMRKYLQTFAENGIVALIQKISYAITNVAKLANHLQNSFKLLRGEIHGAPNTSSYDFQ